MASFASKWAKEPRPANDLGSVGRVSEKTFDSDFFSIEGFEVNVDDKVVRYVKSNRLANKRVHSLFTKEPTTIPWLETFSSDDVFFDIGANVGMYSIYASVVTGCRTYSFEPESLNYAELNKNIFVNGLHGRTTAYNVAISDDMKVGELFLGAFGYSYSHHDFNESTWKADRYFGEKFTPKNERLLQGCVSLSIDQLIFKHGLPAPNHIKIDVDGLEDRVFKGMTETLKQPGLKTVLIEIDFEHPKCSEIIDHMLALGWKVSADQLGANRKVILRPEQIERMRANGKGGFNYIFFKDDFYQDFFAQFIGKYTPPMAVKPA